MSRRSLAVALALAVPFAPMAHAASDSNTLLGGDVIVQGCTTCSPVTVSLLDENRAAPILTAGVNEAAYYYYSAPTNASIDTRRAPGRLIATSTEHDHAKLSASRATR